ncbi:hypothetical protein SPLC1_S207180 [Arthrospira platensis C1]|nr:hypothetical protein SPLC1_S207180 [Arthrospira platensis C1]
MQNLNHIMVADLVAYIILATIFVATQSRHLIAWTDLS